MMSWEQFNATLHSVNFEGCVAVILFAIGFMMLLLNRNLIKKIVGLNIMDTGVYLLLASLGYVYGRKAPIIVNGDTSFTSYINPVPGGLVLTGIVISVSVTAILLALTIRIYLSYHTLDLDEVFMRMKKEEEEEDAS